MITRDDSWEFWNFSLLNSSLYWISLPLMVFRFSSTSYHFVNPSTFAIWALHLNTWRIHNRTLYSPFEHTEPNNMSLLSARCKNNWVIFLIFCSQHLLCYHFHFNVATLCCCSVSFKALSRIPNGKTGTGPL